MLFFSLYLFPTRHSLKTLSEFTEVWFPPLFLIMLFSVMLSLSPSLPATFPPFPQDHECIHFTVTLAQVAFHLPILSNLLLVVRMRSGITSCFLQNIKICIKISKTAWIYTKNSFGNLCYEPQTEHTNTFSLNPTNTNLLHSITASTLQQLQHEATGIFPCSVVVMVSS